MKTCKSGSSLRIPSLIHLAARLAPLSSGLLQIRPSHLFTTFVFQPRIICTNQHLKAHKSGWHPKIASPNYLASRLGSQLKRSQSIGYIGLLFFIQNQLHMLRLDLIQRAEFYSTKRSSGLFPRSITSSYTISPALSSASPHSIRLSTSTSQIMATVNIMRLGAFYLVFHLLQSYFLLFASAEHSSCYLCILKPALGR